MPFTLTRRQVLQRGAVACAITALPTTRLTAQTPKAPSEASPVPRFSIHAAGEAPNGYPEITLDAGESTELGVIISIEEPAAAELTIYRADAVPASGGGFAAAELDDEPTGHTLWLGIEPTTFLGEPGNTYEFTVPVTVPEDAAPGQYVTALVVQTGPLEISGSTTFNQIIRSSLSVVINVPGEITPGMEIGEPEIAVQGGLRYIRIPITNTGNILVRPEGTVVMTTPDGDDVITAEIAMKAIYLGMGNEIRVGIPEQVPDGDYLVSYDLHEPTHGLDAVMEDVPVTLAPVEPEATAEPVTFAVDDVTITPVGDPVQYADVAFSVTNHRSTIPTARLTLVAMRDGEEVETYDIAVNQAILQGEYDFSTRYIPATGWESGEWTFRLIVVAVDSAGTETVLAEVDVEDTITIP